MMRSLVFAKNKILNAKTKIKIWHSQYKERRDLPCKDFSIISNNCWGGLTYQRYGLPYTSPTVGLFIMDNDYINFLEDLDRYLSLPLKFISPSDSKYYDYLVKERKGTIEYPIAILDDVEIFFMHYHSEEEAITKWERRKDRINFKNIFVKMSIRDSNNPDIVKRFVNLPYKHKVIFIPPLPEITADNITVIEIPELKDLNIQGGDETSLIDSKFNFSDYLRIESRHKSINV